MTRRRVTRAAAVGAVAALCLVWGGRSLTRAATPAEGAPPAATPSAQALPSLGDEFLAASSGTLPAPGDLLGSAPGAVTANATEGVAAIPLPPSAYPGMVGLATAALSVWRYRRRRR